MKVLFATTNQSKINNYVEKLKDKGIDVVTLKDININLNVNENDKNASENAYIKAKAYYDETKITSIGMDNNLFFENVPEDKQPGVYVRRINGKELNDDEMIEYYSKLVKSFGGKINAKWVYAICIYDEKGPRIFNWSKQNFYYIDKPCEMRNVGYPLDSLAIIPQYNKYLAALTVEEKNEYNNMNNGNDVIDFIAQNI